MSKKASSEGGASEKASTSNATAPKKPARRMALTEFVQSQGLSRITAAVLQHVSKPSDRLSQAEWLSRLESQLKKEA